MVTKSIDINQANTLTRPAQLVKRTLIRTARLHLCRVDAGHVVAVVAHDWATVPTDPLLDLQERRVVRGEEGSSVLGVEYAGREPIDSAIDEAAVHCASAAVDMRT